MAADDDRQIIEEVGPDGVGTGLEEVRAEVAVPPLDPESIEIQSRPLTVDAALSRLRARTIGLDPLLLGDSAPWDTLQQSRLIESLLLKIPVPALYAVEDVAENWAVVDGIRRLQAIAGFMEPAAAGGEPLTLAGLDYLGADFSGMGFGDLPPRLQRRLREAELVVHVIRHGTPDAVKRNIAGRVNPAVTALSSQELRHVFNLGRSREVLDEFAGSDAFRAATGGTVGTSRMVDRELVLRFAAFRLTPWQDYEADDMDGFLGDATRRLDRLDDGAVDSLRVDFEAAMTVATAIFGADAFRRRYDPDHATLPISRALFEAIAVNLAARSPEDRATLIEKCAEVKDSFMNLMHQRECDVAISGGADDVDSVRTRFRLIDEMFSQVHACSIPSD